jgi:CheY-like chemotaxis protein
VLALETDRPQKPGKRRVSVLVIDDEFETRELLAMLLEKAHYSVVTAADGSAALALLQTVRPELIFLDLQMPGIDGAHFREQQRHDPDWLRIPTIVLTGSNDEPQLDPAIAQTLHKPVKAARLLGLVARYCTRDLG